METFNLPETMAAQLAHHLHRATRLAVAGSCDELIPEVVLAWSIMQMGGGEVLAAEGDADLPQLQIEDDGQYAAAAAKARALALQLCSHFTSEGRSDLAGLYHDVAAELLPV